MSNVEKYALWGLSSIGILTPRRIHTLIARYGSASELWQTPVKEWNIPRMSNIVKSAISKAQQEFDPVSFENNLQKKAIKIITIEDQGYPKRLSHLHDPPLALYVKGELKIDEQDCYLGVVGSRSRKLYGQRVIKDLLPSLIRQGLTIVSGMAYGIDSDSHQCAIDNNGYTIAVIGSGLDDKFISGNFSLVDKILKNGALISEYPPNFEARKWTFPARNRIIAGVSDAVLVVEAGKKSGSLITADFASQLGKEVLAVPGSILSTTSIGTNTLIKNGAKPILASEDIAEEFLTLSVEINKKTKPKLNNELEKKIYSLLNSEPISVDEIVLKLDEKASNIQSTLTILSIRGIIEESAGRLFSIKK
ncbi:DNA-processing protein DprA [Clostridium sp. 'deep sea']|uniref:DNA-processing protein DprA n=1 Tax=Clostridium sp. 'deep sea' TaxID=2779445 RepID=UPI001A9B6891|nr:DNA-processing protein DprA [Clostridium sp. 'deep sea']